MWAWGPLEADFWMYYRINLQEEGFSNRLSWRRFLVLLRGLPAESAYQRWLQNKSNRDMLEWSDDAIYEEMQRSHKKIMRKGGR